MSSEDEGVRQTDEGGEALGDEGGEVPRTREAKP
jgi:hypothetical protein